MSVNSLGDLARAFALRQQNTNLKLEIQKLNQELATGMTSDLADHLGGSYARLTGIEKDLRVREGYGVAIAEAEQFTELMQARLEQIGEITTDLARDLVAADASNSTVTGETLSTDAELQFKTIVSMLNSQAAGRTMFGGDATDRAALVDGTTLFSELETVVAGATTASDIETTLDTWFSNPAGFDTFAYSGSTTDLAPFNLSETTQVDLDIRADNQVLKDVLRSVAMAALANAPGTTLPTDEQSALFRSSGESLLTTERDLIVTQAKVGLAQEQISNWSVRNSTEISGLKLAKGTLLKIDPFDAATELEAAQFQLESLYAVTVRLSQLSLVNFLR